MRLCSFSPAVVAQERPFQSPNNRTHASWKKAAFLKKAAQKTLLFMSRDFPTPVAQILKVFLVSGAPSLFLQKKNRLPTRFTANRWTVHCYAG
jgi:hypothetical protein